MKEKQLYLPTGDINTFGNGASKRTAQIHELLSKEFDLINLNKISRVFFRRFKRYTAALRLWIKHPIKIKSFKDFPQLGYHYLNYRKTVKANQNKVPYLFWESTRQNYHYAPFIYKQLGCKLIAFPHNLESLVPGQNSAVSNKPSPLWLDEELDQLRLCDHVFTISEEEQWFLSLNKIKSTYYPYFPTNILTEKLLSIRKLREHNVTNNFYLIFGSFFYEPIGKGLLEVLKVLNETNIHVKITGFGSDAIFNGIDYALNKNLEPLGETTPSELNDLLASCKGVIINQALSSGALTKLKELQIAGVPAVLNEASTRSFKNTHGFHVYHDFIELKALLVKDLSIPNLPGDNDFYDNRVLEIVNTL